MLFVAASYYSTSVQRSLTDRAFSFRRDKNNIHVFSLFCSSTYHNSHFWAPATVLDSTTDGDPPLTHSLTQTHTHSPRLSDSAALLGKAGPVWRTGDAIVQKLGTHTHRTLCFPHMGRLTCWIQIRCPRGQCKCCDKRLLINGDLYGDDTNTLEKNTNMHYLMCSFNVLPSVSPLDLCSVCACV